MRKFGGAITTIAADSSDRYALVIVGANMQFNDADFLALANLRHTMRNGNPPFPIFLEWIADRLEHVHGESPIVDYMHTIRRYVAEFKEIETHLHRS